MYQLLQKMGDFTFDKIAEETNLVNKYSEIFKSGKKESIDKFKDYFDSYNKIINGTGGMEALISKFKSEFKKPQASAEKMESQPWNEKYFNFCVSGDKKNDVYVYPQDAGFDKLSIPLHFPVNCIKLEDVKKDSIQIGNRSGRMVLYGTSASGEELGVALNFKAMLIHNHDLKKWLVIPYKISNKPPGDVECKTIAMVLSTGDPERQYMLWETGMQESRGKLGIINDKFVDASVKKNEKSFDEKQCKTLVAAANSLTKGSSGGPSTKAPKSAKAPKPAKAPKKASKKVSKKKVGGAKKSSKKKSSKKKSSKKKSSKK